MPNQDGFYVDDRPDTSNTRCMKNCRDANTITEVLAPEYTIFVKTAALKTVALKEAEAKAKRIVVNQAVLATYNGACKVCHSTGIAGAPKFAVNKDWSSRMEQNKGTIYDNALNGLNDMPAKGGRSDLSDETVKAIVDYMLSSVNNK
jgi:cytochrome c